MNNIFQKNLSALKNNFLSFDKHETQKASGHYIFLKARKGETVPAYADNGNSIALHSMIDPVREAQRLISTIPQDTGFIVFLGLGGGFAPKAALEQTNAQIIVIDFDTDGILQLLSNIDYSELFNNSRFTFLAKPPQSAIKSFILENYNPALCGAIKVIPLRARVDFSKSKFNEAAGAIEEAINAVAADYSVQAQFGRCWFSNIIRNIKASSGNLHSFNYPKEIKKAAIVAAGPSLDIQINSIAACKAQNTFIISCDTALPVLFHHGIEPDAVVSIDCQHISYHHFLGCYPRLKSLNIPLLLDIASPPLLSNFSSLPVFFSSSHPLALYISHNYYPFMHLDTSGGNVAYACLSLAELTGAQNITVFGADFSYIGSQSYARGSYIDRVFDKKQNRFSTLETLFSSFLYRSKFLPPLQNGQKYYETSSLRFYREKFEEKASSMSACITIEKGLGAPIRLFKSKQAVKTHAAQFPANSAASGSGFLKQYRDDIAALPLAENRYTEKHPVFKTLLPFAAFLKHRKPALKAKDLLEEVRRQCVQEIDSIL